MLSTYPNLMLKILKWPIAAATVIILPGTFIALWSLVGRVLTKPAPLAWFAAGFAAYFILWYVLFRRKIMGSLFSTFEHELTHTLFAWLTLHRVTGLSASWNSGGEVRYRGKGNWLISIAPYWFPTLCVPLMVMSGMGDFGGQIWLAVALGATFSYHLLSTWRETHAEQPDLHQTTLLFAWLFLPAANLVSAGCIIAFAHAGASSAGVFMQDVCSETGILLTYFMR